MTNDIGIEVVDLTGYTFEAWLDRILHDYQIETTAFNFNLYDNLNHTYSMEIIGSPIFDKDDAGWATEEVYASRDHYSMFDYVADNRETVLNQASKSICDYLVHGEYADVLKKSVAVACGFIDEDLKLLYLDDVKCNYCDGE